MASPLIVKFLAVLPRTDVAVETQEHRSNPCMPSSKHAPLAFLQHPLYQGTVLPGHRRTVVGGTLEPFVYGLRPPRPRSSNARCAMA